MKWLATAVVLFLIAFTIFVTWALDDRNDYETACADLGGFAVKSHLGSMVCIDRDALIEVER